MDGGVSAGVDSNLGTGDGNGVRTDVGKCAAKTLAVVSAEALAKVQVTLRVSARAGAWHRVQAGRLRRHRAWRGLGYRRWCCGGMGDGKGDGSSMGLKLGSEVGRLVGVHVCRGPRRRCR